MIQKKVSGDYGGESKHMASSALGRIAVKVNGDECANKKQPLTCYGIFSKISCMQLNMWRHWEVQSFWKL